MTNKNHCVGDLVQITANNHNHEFKIGQIVKIVKIDDKTGGYEAVEPHDENPDFWTNTGWEIDDSECKAAPIEPGLFDS